MNVNKHFSLVKSYEYTRWVVEWIVKGKNSLVVPKWIVKGPLFDYSI
jgi:hypothetical protein